MNSDRLIAADKQHGIGDIDGFNNLRIGLSRLDAKNLAVLGSKSGAEVMARFPGPSP